MKLDGEMKSGENIYMKLPKPYPNGAAKTAPFFYSTPLAETGYISLYGNLTISLSIFGCTRCKTFKQA